MPNALSKTNSAVAQQTPRQRRASQLLAAGVFSLLLFAPLAFGSTDPWAIFALQAGSALLLVLWVVRQSMSPELTIQTNALFAPMVAFAALALVQILFRRSAYPYQTRADLFLYLAYGTLAFLAAQTVRRVSQIRKLAVLFSIYGKAIALFADFRASFPAAKSTGSGAPILRFDLRPLRESQPYAGLMELRVPIPLVASFTSFLHGREKLFAASARP